MNGGKWDLCCSPPPFPAQLRPAGEKPAPRRDVEAAGGLSWKRPPPSLVVHVPATQAASPACNGKFLRGPEEPQRDKQGPGVTRSGQCQRGAWEPPSTHTDLQAGLPA